MAPDLKMHWQDQKVIKHDGNWTVDGRPGTTFDLISQNSPTNIPNHLYLGLKVTSPVHGATPPHYHGGAAINATMLSGTMINQMVCPEHDPDSQGSGPQIYGPGDSWYEPPGCHHVRSENVGDEPAVFVAWFVIDKEYFGREGMKGLVVIDAEVEEKKKNQGS